MVLPSTSKASNIASLTMLLSQVSLSLTTARKGSLLLGTIVTKLGPLGSSKKMSLSQSPSYHICKVLLPWKVTYPQVLG